VTNGEVSAHNIQRNSLSQDDKLVLTCRRSTPSLSMFLTWVSKLFLPQHGKVVLKSRRLDTPGQISSVGVFSTLSTTNNTHHSSLFSRYVPITKLFLKRFYFGYGNPCRISRTVTQREFRSSPNKNRKIIFNYGTMKILREKNKNTGQGGKKN